MSKKLNLVVFSFLTLIGAVSAQTLDLALTSGVQNKSVKFTSDNEDTNSMKFGYCLNEMVNAIGPNSAAALQAAIYFPAEEIENFVGSEITKIHIRTGDATGTNAKVFISKEEKGEAFYTQDITLTRNQWNEIELETALLIEQGENYFIGYEANVAASARLIGLSAGPANKYGDYLAIGGKWDHLVDLGFNYNVSVFVTIEGDNLIENEISLLTIEFPYHSDIKEKYEITGTLKNIGAQTLTSFEIEYQIGDAEPVNQLIQNLNVANFDTYDFAINDIEINEIGYSNVTVKIKNPNETVGNGNELSRKATFFNAENNDEQRKVLIEHFTTAQCPQCPAGHTAIENAVSTRSNIIWVSHHSGYGEDSYTIQANRDYLWFYNSNSVYAPGAMLDRRNLVAYGPNTNDVYSPLFSVNQSNVGGLLDIELDFPPFVIVELERNYTVDNRNLEITVSSNSIENMPLGDDVRLTIFLVENGLKGTQAGASGTYTHNHVVRQVVAGGSWGEKITYDTNGNFDKTYNVTVNSAWDAENMYIVAFVYNYDPSDPNNCLVYNAETIDTGAPVTSLDKNNADNVLVYTQHSTVTIDGEFTTGVVYDVTGKLVKQFNNDQKTFTLNSGVYIMKIDNNVHKVIIK